MKKFSRAQKKNLLKKLPLGLAVVFFLIVLGVIAWQYRADLSAQVFGPRWFTPSITVALPNQDAANQSFAQGTQQLITWKSTGGITTPLTISLHSGSKPASYNVKPPLTGQPVSGSYQWTVPSDLSGSNYYINVMGKNSSGGKVNVQTKFFNIVTQSSAAAPRCGDGIVQAARGEECDGSTSQGAVCTKDCRNTKVGLACPSGTIPAKTTRFTLRANSSTQAGATIRNGLSVPAGTYAIGVRSGSVSYWPANNVDTTKWGGGPGRTWAVLADVAYWKNGLAMQTRVPQNPGTLYANMQDPWFNHLGVGRVLNIDSKPNPAEQNLFVFLMDTGAIADNRGSEEIELIKCE